MIAGIALAAALTATPAEDPAPPQQQGCQDYKTVMSDLRERYGEVVVWRGLGPAGVYQLMQSKAGTWTWLLVRRDMKACLLLAGLVGGEVIPPPDSAVPGRDT